MLTVICGKNPGACANSIFMVRVKPNWSGKSKLPWAYDVRFVGEAGAIHAETEALLLQNGVDHGDFPHTVLQSLQEFSPKKKGDNEQT